MSLWKASRANAIDQTLASSRMPRARIQQRAKQVIGYLPSPVDLHVLELLRWAISGATRRKRRNVARVWTALGRQRVVLGGPFRGMRYLSPRFASQGEFLPKLLGTYEAELAPTVDAIIAAAPDLLVNIGAAEGYYAIGFALRCPGTPITCFELERPYHTAIRQLADANDVAARIAIRGECTAEALEQSLAGTVRATVLCDCEGAEDMILDPSRSPSLRRATILVELHDMLRPGVSRNLRERFEATHRIRVIACRPRGSADLPEGIELTSEDASIALSEGRQGSTEWFYMCPLSHAIARPERPGA